MWGDLFQAASRAEVSVCGRGDKLGVGIAEFSALGLAWIYFSRFSSLFLAPRCIDYISTLAPKRFGIFVIFRPRKAALATRYFERLERKSCEPPASSGKKTPFLKGNQG